jgi:hypothetical protein
LKHPFEYASYRAEVYFVFLFPPTNSFYIFEDGITPNDNGLKVQFKRLGTITSKYVNNWGYKYFPFMFEPWFWLFASAAMVAITKKRSKHRLYISMLGLSSVLYILGYFPTGATVDYRYIYWPVLATLFGLVLLVIDRFREKRKVK